MGWTREMFCGAALAAAMTAGHAQAQEAPKRIVSVGGAVTEIVYALGEESRLVARDTTSSYPPVAEALPDVGYIRRLSPEGVLSVNPDLILSEAGAGPLEALELLREAEIPVVEVEDGYTPEAIAQKINKVAEVLGVPDKGAALAAKVTSEIAEASAIVDTSYRPKVLFVLSMAGGRVMAAGENTSADAIIELAGGQNAVSGFEGYKPLTDEAIATSGVEVILMMARDGTHDAAIADLQAHPALGKTPAAQAGALVRIDGLLLLGFSVRTGQAIKTLSSALIDAQS